MTRSEVLIISVVKKPAKKARKGINPFTGEATTFKVKPAHNVVKIRPLKNYKILPADSGSPRSGAGL